MYSPDWNRFKLNPKFKMEEMFAHALPAKKDSCLPSESSAVLSNEQKRTDKITHFLFKSKEKGGCPVPMENQNEKTHVTEELNCTALLLLNNTICMENPEEMLKPWKTNPLFFQIVLVHAATFIFGLCGNAIVIAVLTRSGKARTATNSFLVSLASGDLLMLCIYGPLETYTHFVIGWDENGAVCKTAKLVEFLSAVSSVLNLLAVTIERFLVIVYPMKSRTLCTNSNTLKAIMGVWFTSTVLASPILFTTGTYAITFTNGVTTITLNYCNHSVDSLAFVFYQFIIVFFLPGMIMIVCYAFVIRKLWASTRKMVVLTNGVSQLEKTCREPLRVGGECETRQHAKGRSTNSKRDEVNVVRKQVIKMLILVVFLFYASWGPRLTMDLLQKLRMVPFTQDVYLLRIIFNMITFFHSCINPFVYSFMSRNFRNSFLKQLEKCGFRQASEWVRLRGTRNALHEKSPENRKKLCERETKRCCDSGELKSFRGSFVSSLTKTTEVESVPR